MPTSAPAGPAASAAGLVKVYGAGGTAVRALDGVTADFPAGEFTAIMGPSGSGKSTLMHCLAGLDTVTSGSVRLGGTELSGLSDRALTRLRRSRAGFVFQSFNLLPTLTAEQNIRLPLVLSNGRAGVAISASSDPALRGFTVVSGRVPAAPGEVAVDRATAADEHFRLGQLVGWPRRTARSAATG